MNTTNKKNLASIAFLAVAGMIIVFAFSSCATKASFLASTVVPAAQGTVTVKKDKNANYLVKIQIINLAQPDKLQPSKNVYVVWMETDENETENMGQIQSSSGMLSKKLKADFKTVTAVKPTKIFLTAENSPNVEEPGRDVILTTRKF